MNEIRATLFKTIDLGEDMIKKFESRKNSIGRKYLLRTGFSAIIFIVYMLINFIYIVGVINEHKKIQKELDKLDEHLSDLYISVINQETGQRGFILTNNHDFLQPYHEGKVVFRGQEKQLNHYLDIYPQFSEHIQDTIKKGEYWTNNYGEPQIQMSKLGENPSEDSLKKGKIAFDTFRESYQISHQFVEKKKINLENAFYNKLILMFSLTSLFSVLVLLFIWYRMFMEFRSIITPIILLSHCVKDYTQNIFSTKPPLYKAKDELGDLISNIETMRLELEMNMDYMEKKAYTDGLTGVFNRRYFDKILHNEWERQRRLANKISIILFDIDYFKKFNDKYGHVAGDDCLKKVAEKMQELFHQSSDVPVRYGGEEFAILLLEQDEEKVLYKAEQLRKEIEYLNIPHEDSNVSNWITISVGIATVIPNEHLEIKSFINRADKALYKSKLSGRNQVNSSTY
ncbi:hypothetical protein CHH83_10430 [Bacillus sp. 7586-K]|nr:hypothetical protein CHH83_10430 [Bacillus sp. 7586-K]